MKAAFGGASSLSSEGDGAERSSTGGARSTGAPSEPSALSVGDMTCAMSDPLVSATAVSRFTLSGSHDEAVAGGYTDSCPFPFGCSAIGVA